MKKFVVAGLFAIGMLAITHQPASAWVNSKFGIGLNWNYQAGGNQVLWGAWRNGQPPGPEAFGGGHGHHHAPIPQYYTPQSFAPMPQPYAPQGVQSMEPPIAQQQYTAPYQFANYPRPTYYYYYPSQYYYYGR